MRVLVIGGGGREHAIVWKLSNSEMVNKIFVAPGNAGTSSIAENCKISSDNLSELLNLATKEKIDLTIVGPETPLAEGIVDLFQKHKLRIFGPSGNGARLEGSKVFAKEFMRRWGIPTANFNIFDDEKDAFEYIKSTSYPEVIKVDGLAAGKGVIIAKDYKEAYLTVESIMVNKKFGRAGDKIVIEECLNGEEVSILAFLDGENFITLLPTQDHKKIFDNDEGPNTGGMGAYCPVSVVNSNLSKTIEENILIPTIKGLKNEEIEYKGILYLGLMITEDGPKVLEYNVRFGDPETQPILSLMESDITQLFISSIEGTVSKSKLKWKDMYAICVVIASKGYPGEYEKRKAIEGLENLVEKDGVFVFHAGTEKSANKILTSGGRVLNVVGIGESIEKAYNRAYEAIEEIKFENIYFRRDIGRRELNRSKNFFDKEN